MYFWKYFSGTDESSAGDCGEVIDLDTANEVITYEGTKLAERRVNAWTLSHVAFQVLRRDYV